MKTWQIALVGALALIGVFAFEFLIHFVFLLVMLSSAALFVWGWLSFSAGRRIGNVRLPRPEFQREVPRETRVFRLEGRWFSAGELPCSLPFRIRLRNTSILFGAVVFVGAAVVSWLRADVAAVADPSRNDYGPWFLLTYCSFVFVALAGIWWYERHLLAHSAVALAQVIPAPRHGRISYTFCDQNGEYFGGTAWNFSGGGPDNIGIVFFNPQGAGHNKIGCGLLFHRIQFLKT